MANYNINTFLQSYIPTDTAIALVNIQGITTSLVNVCTVTKILTEEKEVWIILPDTKVVLVFSSVSEAQLALTVLQTALDTLVANCATGTGSTGIETINVTHTELLNLAGSLVVGNKYRLTDYQCEHTILDASGNEILNTTLDPEDDGYPPVEVLILTATADNQVDPVVVSETWPLDIIHYSPSSQVGLGTKGVVTYRKNTENNDEATYDFRGTTAYRWESTPGSEIFVSTTYPGGGYAYKTLKAFGNSTSGTLLGNNKDKSGLFPSNNYIDVDCMGITLEEDVYNSTVATSQECNVKKGSFLMIILNSYGTTVSGSESIVNNVNYSTVEGEQLNITNKSGLIQKGTSAESTFDIDLSSYVEPNIVFSEIPAGAIITELIIKSIEGITTSGDSSTEQLSFGMDGSGIIVSNSLALAQAVAFTIDQWNTFAWARISEINDDHIITADTELETRFTAPGNITDGLIRVYLKYICLGTN